MKMTDNMIDQMQHNTRSMAALRLPPPDGQPDLADALEKMDVTDLLLLTNVSDWVPANHSKRSHSATYRLRPDYEPEPKFLPCPNCGCVNIKPFSYNVEGNKIWQCQCNNCLLAMETGWSQSDADRKWNEMAGEMAGRLWI